MQGDFADQMLAGMDKYLLRELAASGERRPGMWKRDFASREAYEQSIAPNRRRFRTMIGLVDDRLKFQAPSLEATLAQPAKVAAGSGYEILSVRWPVLPGVDGVGLLLKPTGPIAAGVVALPDADWTPEMLAGVAPGIPPAAQFARRLAENGCQVLIPVLLSRRPTGLLKSGVRNPTNQTHREFIYRMAFEVGRHVAGYEVQKVLAAVDWFSQSSPGKRIGVFGYGEGGLVVLYAAAADTRIDVAAISGYFQPRQDVWREPVYRNVWGLLTEFGDAELAGLIAPRALLIEASRGPEIPGPPPAGKEFGTGAAPGSLASPDLSEVRKEFSRAKLIFDALRASGSLRLFATEAGEGPGCDPALAEFLRELHVGGALKPAGRGPVGEHTGSPAEDRERSQFDQLVAFNQSLVGSSEFSRKQFWAKADKSDIERWKATKTTYQRYLWEEILGKLPPPSEPLQASTRRIYDRPKWTGYEVFLPLYSDVFAYGVLLVPKDLKPGERRPVVVTQHGRAGRPQDVVDAQTERATATYKNFAALLADRGFIVYAPQNPYIFEERYRYIQRKANPLKASLFSFILSQHERTLDWLAGLPFVDPQRMAFYGLSYGGKTAVRVPPLLDKYALSICSGDFNEYAGKMAAIDRPDSFMFTIEHEMYEFDLANTFNYSDMANLMAPRPFMVERGHKDGVGLDEFVAYEYAKVRRFYTLLGLADQTAIEFFNGVHEIHAAGTFRFLHEKLRWPEK